MNRILLLSWRGFYLLFWSILFAYSPSNAQAIDYSDIFWFYGQSDYGITFRKSDFVAELDSIQNPNFGIGGSAVASDPLSGDLSKFVKNSR